MTDVTAEVTVTSHPDPRSASDAARAAVAELLRGSGYTPVGEARVVDTHLAARSGRREYWTARAEQDGNGR